MAKKKVAKKTSTKNPDYDCTNESFKQLCVVTIIVVAILAIFAPSYLWLSIVLVGGFYLIIAKNKTASSNGKKNK